MNIDKLVRKVLLEVDDTGKNVSSEVNLNDPRSVLQHAISTPSCFPSKGYPISEMRVASKDLAAACGVSEGTNYAVGTTGTTTAYFFGAKDTKTNPNPDSNGLTHFQLCITTDSGKTYEKINTGRTWGCKDAFAQVSDINKYTLSPEQTTQLKNYVTQVGGVYSEFPPEGYTEQEYDKYDVKKIKALGDTFVDFPDNKMFIWVRKGLMNATPDQVLEVRNLIDKLTPKLTTKIPTVGSTRMSWCITGKGLFPTDDFLPLGIKYENLKSRIDDPNSGVKKGTWTLFCPDDTSIRTVNTDSSDMKKCSQAIKYLYSCKTKGGRSKYNKTTGTPSDMSQTEGTESPCYDFKTQFKNRYLAYACNSKKMYDKTKDVFGLGIKKEVNDLFSDLTTNYSLGSFNKNLQESIRISNTLDYTINKVVLEAINNKKLKSENKLESIVKKNLLEQFKLRGR